MIYRFLPLRFYIHLLIDVLFASKKFLAFQPLIAMKLSGVSDTVKTNGEAAIPSSSVNPVAQPGISSGDVNPIPSGLVKPVAQTDVSSGDAIAMKSKDVTAEAKNSIKPNGKTGASSGLKLGVRGRASVSSVDKGKAIVSENVGKVITFKDITFGPHEDEVRFRLIHFWEAWNVQTKVLIGIEMLLIDEEESVIQGFIPYGRIDTYLRHMKTGATYRLNKFFGSKSKTIYRVAESSVTICFSSNSVLSGLEDTGSDLRGDLYDYIGHIKLVNGKVPGDGLLLDESEIAKSRRVELHVQTHDDPVLKLYLWDKVAFEFCEKFKASGGTARVILVTTLNPKWFGGVLSISSMASSRVFLDGDVEETLLYLSWLDSNLDVASRVNAEVVTKPELATLGDLFSYMNQASAKVAWFECTATIYDVVNGSGWYYIGCGVCHTKATKGPTTLMCKKCGKSEIVGVPQYLSKLSVYDHSDQAVFVVLGDAGEELTGKKAAELVERYYEANDSVGEDHIVPVPQAMIDTIGQTRKFIVKVSTHNLTAKTQTLTVTKVLPLEAPEPEGNVGVNVGKEGDSESEDHADKLVKRGADGIESEDYIGHIKLVNGKVPGDGLLLDESEIAKSRRVELHVQTHDDPVLKLYLWDKVAFEFCEKFKASGGTARVILVTTLNPKWFGGVLSISSMASSRVFLDGDVEETLLYLSWLDSNLDVASRVNAEVVTKPELATLGDLFSYMNQASAKVAWFECTATIYDVVNGSGWYYIGCGVCHTKATKGPTTLMCKKCGKSEIVGVPQYLSKLSVYDHSDQAVFVVLGDAGEELTGKKAAELVERYYEANDSVGEDHIVPVPQAMIDTIGQTRKFIVKVSTHNLTAKTQTLTVTKVLPLEAPEPEGNVGVNVGKEGDSESEDHADKLVKRGADGIESEGVKRAKCG
ncbi:hypothetical protein IGI04_022348 [Brassica rapa subsp. trilocularis]|uniref:Replication factor A C-terminal domain-containing protein n=2 Tax=Brassica campestris TaxID=3711 RepID=A0ABQ7M0Q7_BRACM|nr:hypothetical protein IGI04_022348 [Brassica rapa subsp. trilocularis]